MAGKQDVMASNEDQIRSEVIASRDTYVLCVFDFEDPADDVASKFITNLLEGIHLYNAEVVLHSRDKDNWHVIEGKQHLEAQDHLSPAIFDFNYMVLTVWDSFPQVQEWWRSNELFSNIKLRHALGQPMKMGVYSFDGVFPVEPETCRYLFLEFLSFNRFREMQAYLDMYKRYGQKAVLEIGIDVRVLFCGTPHDTLLSEFPIDGVVATGWKLKTDPSFWFTAPSYRKDLEGLRQQNSTSLTVVIPLQDAPKNPGNPLQTLMSRGRTASTYR
mmetsp:Transcript_27530/g.71432  ORF Transcript_27530/g.71432 Transcript_27530/m.71432 type:complete len:272 (-) Transcript_27530:73-888(-)